MKKTSIYGTLSIMLILFTSVLTAQTDNGGVIIPRLSSDQMITLNGIATVQVHNPLGHLSSIYLTPLSDYGDSSMVFFAEDNDASYGMYWLYAGSGGDEMELWGRSLSSNLGPYFKVKRSTGDVSIGDTYATGYKLSVGGKIICTELRVNDVASWPDYVFAVDYPLMPVNEMASYVQQNGHLPNIPPANEIESSGMDLGEMQRLMMEKIEELSLYIILQQKEIEELRDQLSAIER